jgi:hypothetical protein
MLYAEREATMNAKRMTWKQMARTWDRTAPNSPERRAILRECRACGYTPRAILAIHGSRSF